MNTNEINRVFRNDSRFIGTFCADNLTASPKKKYSFIFNTDPCSKSGSHWVACYINNGTAEYFNSFGMPPLNHTFFEFLEKEKLNLCYSPVILQHPLSIHCGLFCIRFLQARMKGIAYSQFISVFSRDSIENDLILYTYNP